MNLDEVLPYASNKRLPALHITPRPVSAPPVSRNGSQPTNGHASVHNSRAGTPVQVAGTSTTGSSRRGAAAQLGLGPKPQKCPTMDKVVTRFSELRGKLSTWKLRSQLARKYELWYGYDPAIHIPSLSVDVRDVAHAHVLALKVPPSEAPKRFIVSSNTFTWKEAVTVSRRSALASGCQKPWPGPSQAVRSPEPWPTAWPAILKSQGHQKPGQSRTGTSLTLNTMGMAGIGCCLIGGVALCIFAPASSTWHQNWCGGYLIYLLVFLQIICVGKIFGMYFRTTFHTPPVGLNVSSRAQGVGNRCKQL